MLGALGRVRQSGHGYRDEGISVNVVIPLVDNVIDPLTRLPDGRCLLQEVVAALPHVDLVITISHPSLMIGEQHFKSYAWYPINIKRQPVGILDTLMEARRLIDNNQELIVNYPNCYLPNDQMVEFIHEMRKLDRWAGAVCFPSKSPLFLREPSNKFAMAGLFYFKQGKTFVRMVKGYRADKQIDVGHIALAVRGWLDISKSSAYVTDDIVYLKTPQMLEAYLQLQRAKSLETLEGNKLERSPDK
jgi:hypothetical protein